MIPIIPSLNKRMPYMVAKTTKVTLSNGDNMYVHAGFQTNYASIPGFLRYFFNHIGVFRDAFVIHDYHYRYGGYFLNSELTSFKAVSCREANREMWYQMMSRGAEKWRADVYYKAVKCFGYFTFLK